MKPVTEALDLPQVRLADPRHGPESVQGMQGGMQGPSRRYTAPSFPVFGP
jgi:hypothetical protein